MNTDPQIQLILSPSVTGFNSFSKASILKAGITKFSEKSSSHLIILDDTRVEEASFILPRTHKYYLLESKLRSPWWHGARGFLDAVFM
jgi:hypothetical protein